jgi:hypothetical protein
VGQVTREENMLTIGLAAHQRAEVSLQTAGADDEQSSFGVPLANSGKRFQLKRDVVFGLEPTHAHDEWIMLGDEAP